MKKNHKQRSKVYDTIPVSQFRLSHHYLASKHDGRDVTDLSSLSGAREPCPFRPDGHQEHDPHFTSSLVWPHGAAIHRCRRAVGAIGMDYGRPFARIHSPSTTRKEMAETSTETAGASCTPALFTTVLVDACPATSPSHFSRHGGVQYSS